MSVASLSGYLANGGGGGGGDTFEKIYIGETGKQVELNCAIKDNLNVTGITTKEIGIYNDAGDARALLTCKKDRTLDIDNIDTFTLEIYPTNTKGSVILNCESDNVLSVGNIKIADKGITFPDNSTQITAYTGGGDGNVFETITIGADGNQVILSCDTEDFLLISGDIAATQDWVNENFKVSTITAGTGIDVNDDGNGSFTITNTVNSTDFLTTANATATYETITNANATFETKTDAATTYQPIGNYITSGSSSVMFAYNYTTSHTITAGNGLKIDITPVPNIGYDSSHKYECIIMPIYSSASLPITIQQCFWDNNGGGKGEIFLYVFNNNTIDSTITSIIAYGFKNI